MPKKPCATDQILNPATGRCVKKTGLIGQQLLKGQSTTTKTQSLPVEIYVVMESSHPDADLSTSNIFRYASQIIGASPHFATAQAIAKKFAQEKVDVWEENLSREERGDSYYHILNENDKHLGHFYTEAYGVFYDGDNFQPDSMVYIDKVTVN